MVPAMVESVETMLEKWTCHKGKKIEVYEEFRHLTSEVISRTAFGSSYLEGKNIFEMLTQLGFIIFKNEGKIRFLKDMYAILLMGCWFLPSFYAKMINYLQK